MSPRAAGDLGDDVVRAVLVAGHTRLDGQVGEPDPGHLDLLLLQCVDHHVRQ
jgi:hypothetical protein